MFIGNELDTLSRINSHGFDAAMDSVEMRSSTLRFSPGLTAISSLAAGNLGCQVLTRIEPDSTPFSFQRPDGLVTVYGPGETNATHSVPYNPSAKIRSGPVSTRAQDDLLAWRQSLEQRRSGRRECSCFGVTVFKHDMCAQPYCGDIGIKFRTEPRLNERYLDWFCLRRLIFDIHDRASRLTVIDKFHIAHSAVAIGASAAARRYALTWNQLHIACKHTCLTSKGGVAQKRDCQKRAPSDNWFASE